MLKLYKVRYLLRLGIGSSFSKGGDVHRNIAILVVSQVVAGLLVVGCGGSSDSSEGPIDKATFVQRAEVICKKTSGRLAAETSAQAQKKFETPATQSVVRIITTIAVPGLESELDEIRALGVPSEEAKQVRTFVTSLEQSIASAKAEPVAFAKGESPPYETAELVSRRIGMSSCPVTSAGATG
jgi:hypothetical protein